MSSAWDSLMTHMRESEPPTEVHLVKDGRSWVATYDSPFQGAKVKMNDPVDALEELARKVLL